MSKQPKQTVRKKIRINEEKSIPAQVALLPALSGQGLPTRHPHSWQTKSSSTRPGRRLQCLLLEFWGQIHSLSCQYGSSYGVAVCWTILKSPSLLCCFQIGNGHLGHSGGLSDNPERQDPRSPLNSLLIHQHQRLSAWSRLFALFHFSSHLSI